MAGAHPTAAELFRIVRQGMPQISLGTVYRNLQLLTSSGIIRKLDTPGSEARFDADLTPHRHARCLECGRIGDLPDVPLTEPGAWVRRTEGWEIIERRVEYLGICPECRSGTKDDQIREQN